VQNLGSRQACAAQGLAYAMIVEVTNRDRATRHVQRYRHARRELPRLFGLAADHAHDEQPHAQYASVRFPARQWRTGR